ncbi:MAG: DUF72 domain-containing protein [Candidatus Aminicenantes bacterium]|jgi:uncharacterized protein YecE (DUF72 family)
MKVSIPEEYRNHLRIGTCSWKFDSWKGLYYDPEKTYRPDDYLPDYARYLNSVEVDQWFWSLFPSGVKLPELRTVKTYTESVPQGFIFTVKVPNSITLTHFYTRQSRKQQSFAGQPNKHFLDSELFAKFLERLALMGDKLGPLMFQFEYMNKKKMPSKEVFFEKFGDFISKAPKDFEYALEIRNPNYLSSEFFDFLRDRGIGYVYLDGYYMPPIGEVFEKHQPSSADFSVIRLHGGDRQAIEKATDEVWSRVAAPKPEGLQDAARIVKANLRRGMRTYVNINNHYEGSAPLTIDRFLDVLIHLE